MDVTCIWGGEIVVSVTLTFGGVIETHDMKFEGEEVNFNGYKISIINK